MILGFNGQRVWCRTTEEKILQAMENDYESHKRISIRDTVIVRKDLSREYILWNTPLVKTSQKDNISIYIASNTEESYRYYHNYVPAREFIISNTTKSRLNAFLSYYDFDALEVHSSKKEWCVKHKGKELALDCWYKLDLKTKELVKE